MHSVMVVRHGKVIAEAWWQPQTPETPHVLWSLSKSFCSTAVGLAIAEGKLKLDDEVLKFFPDEAPKEPSKNLKEMRVRDLLCMSTGHETEPNFRAEPNGNWVKIFLAHPVPHKPGTHFKYNTPATYMQSAIVQKVTGQTVVDYLQLSNTTHRARRVFVSDRVSRRPPTVGELDPPVRWRSPHRGIPGRVLEQQWQQLDDGGRKHGEL